MPALIQDTIRQSTRRDLEIVTAWLREQERQGISDTFCCNLEVIEIGHSKGRLVVYVDGRTDSPVAFQLGGLIYPGILEVRHDMRGRGIGRKLVEHCIQRARERNECILNIECTPSTSVPFWKKMGFRLLDPKAARPLAYRIVDKRHQLPVNGVPAKVTIRFFRLEQMHTKGAKPCKLSRPGAVRTPDGMIHLDQQVLFYPALYPNIIDAVVRIEVDGNTLCFEKAKYPLARRLGVQQCAHGFFIDRIDPSAVPQVSPQPQAQPPP